MPPPRKVIAPVRSRCQLLRFPAPSEADVSAALARAFRRYEREMVPRTAKKVEASRQCCAELHSPAMIDTYSQTQRKALGGDKMVRQVAEMRERGVGAGDAASGALDRAAFGGA